MINIPVNNVNEPKKNSITSMVKGRKKGRHKIMGGLGVGDIFKILLGKVSDQADLSIGDTAKLDSFKEGMGEHFNANIAPMKQELEEQRLKYLKTLSNRVFYVTLGLAILIPTVLYFDISYIKNTEFILSKITLAVIGIAYYWALGPAREYIAEVKEKVFASIVSFLGDNFTYGSSGGMFRGKVANSDIIPKYEDWNDDDYITGDYKDVTIELEETRLTYQSGTGKHRRTVTSFKGVMVLLSMHKNFQGKTIVKRDPGKIGGWFAEKFGSLENVKLEDPQFEAMFEVYSNDQIESRYLLTTAFMERLQKLREKFQAIGAGGKGDFQCSFYENRLLITIPCGKDLFEPHKITEPAVSVEEIVNLLEEMELIYQIIDVLKLNQNIGL